MAANLLSGPSFEAYANSDGVADNFPYTFRLWDTANNVISGNSFHNHSTSSPVVFQQGTNTGNTDISANNVFSTA